MASRSSLGLTSMADPVENDSSTPFSKNAEKAFVVRLAQSVLADIKPWSGAPDSARGCDVR
ncbi:hypothetical protein PG985_015617 [Apiospora marii]|uniref:Uncharacterized protein n=1 Tax=Apiospora marii TaxID=335849 RepID=A0ABR1S4Z1_9PEZI